MNIEKAIIDAIKYTALEACSPNELIMSEDSFIEILILKCGFTRKQAKQYIAQLPYNEH